MWWARRRHSAAAQLSLPYAVAARVELGGAGLDAYQEDALLGAAMARRMAAIDLVVDPRQSATDEPLVSVRTTEGRVHTRQAGPPLGSPSNPLSDTAIRAKFRDLATRSIPRDQAQHIERLVLALDEVPDVRVVTALLARRASEGPCPRAHARAGTTGVPATDLPCTNGGRRPGPPAVSASMLSADPALSLFPSRFARDEIRLIRARRAVWPVGDRPLGIVPHQVAGLVARREVVCCLTANPGVVDHP